MRDVPAGMEAIWRSGQYTGDQKPMARLTVQRPTMRLHDYALTSAYQGYTPSATGVSDTSTQPPATYLPQGKAVTDTYADFLMENENTPLELRNLRSISWSRDIDADVAECTVELYNSAPASSTNERVVDLDAPGSYTYNRGSAYFASRWVDHTSNEWAGLLMPDNLLKSYEGYGVDYDLPPERDPHLMLTGTWIIDSVTATADGLMTLTCRDVGRILLDQYVFPPVVPSDFYPPSFEAWPKDPVQVGETVSGATGFVQTDTVKAAITAATDLTQLRVAVQGLGTIMGCAVQVASAGGQIAPYTWDAVSGDQFAAVKAGCLTLAGEVGKYPQKFYSDTNLDTFTIAGAIHNVQGGAGAAAFAYDGRIIVIDVATDFAGVFHHEFTHIWQRKIYDYFNAQIAQPWRALNPPGFVYGAVPAKRQAGFMTPYAQSSIDEDVADTMRHMITSGEYQEAVSMLLVGDARLNGKVALVRKMLTYISHGGTNGYTVDMGAADYFLRAVSSAFSAGGASTVAADEKVPLTPLRSSNVFWNPPGSNPAASLGGHRLADAFDEDPATFWLSVGNSLPSRPFAYEWIEASVPNMSLNEFRFATYKTGYTAYANVMVNGVWQGNETIPYSRDGIGRNDANIKYVASCPVTTEGEVVLNVGKWDNVQKVRLTLGSLQNIRSSASPYNYRAAIRSFACYISTGPQIVRTPIMALLTGPEGANPGYYRNYTNLVKLFLAWGGWFWPQNGYFKQSDGRTVSPFFIAPDEVEDALGVKDGRVWGDFQQTAAAGPSALKEDNWDKKTLMDGIAYCSEITGAIFYIDESGAANFRLPNLYEPGNYRNGLTSRPGRTRDHWIIDERQTLMSLSSTISSANVREGVYVSNNTGDVAAIVGGYNPNPTGIRRYGGWTDSGFETQAEVQRMADMIVIRQLMTYRQDTLTIPGMPGIQIDDQIRVNERVTSEGYLHYVKSIRSSNNFEEGTWTYDLTTHWLGDTAGGDLANPSTESVISRPTFTSSAQVATGASEAGALGSAGTSEDTWLFRLDDLGEGSAKEIRRQLQRTNYEIIDRRDDESTATGGQS